MMACRRATKCSLGAALAAILLICAAVLPTSVQGKKEDMDLVFALLDKARSRFQQQEVSNPFGNRDEIADLAKEMMAAFSPLMRVEGADTNETATKAPNVRFLAYTTGEEDDSSNTRNLLEDDKEASDSASAAGVGEWAMNNPAVSAWASLFNKIYEKWPLYVTGIWMKRGMSLGGGSCTFDFESHKNWKYLPLQWKMTDANCRDVDKSDGLFKGNNRWCVKFKILEYISFTHCAPSRYWQELVRGEIISVNPTNGATQIDALALLQSGGLDQFLPLRSALGSGGLLDVLNYL